MSKLKCALPPQHPEYADHHHHHHHPCIDYQHRLAKSNFVSLKTNFCFFTEEKKRNVFLAFCWPFESACSLKEWCNRVLIYLSITRHCISVFCWRNLTLSIETPTHFWSIFCFIYCLFVSDLLVTKKKRNSTHANSRLISLMVFCRVGQWGQTLPPSLPGQTNIASVDHFHVQVWSWGMFSVCSVRRHGMLCLLIFCIDVMILNGTPCWMPPVCVLLCAVWVFVCPQEMSLIITDIDKPSQQS